MTSGPLPDESGQIWSHGGTHARYRKQKSAMAVKPRQVSSLDWVCMACGLAVLVFSFFDFYTHELRRDFGATTRASSAWAGWGALAGMLAIIIAVITSVTFLLGAFVRNDTSRGLRTRVLAGYVLTLVALVVAFFVVPHLSFGAVDAIFGGSERDGHGWGYWGAVVATVLAVALAAWRRRAFPASSARHGAGDADGGAASLP